MLNWGVGIVGVICFSVGVAVGYLAFSDTSGGTWRRRAATASRAIAALALLAFVGAAIVALVLVANQGDGNDAAWAEIISLTALLLVTLLVYAAGPRCYTVQEEITDGETVKHKVGAYLSTAEYRALSAENQGKATYQRGRAFRSLYVGADGRWSTSKVQALLWTYAIVFALVALFVADHLGLESGQGGELSFSGIEFREEYLLLLGGPFAAAVLAKGIMTTKVENGTITKPEAPTEKSAVTGFREVISDDGGNVDLVDFQYFLFNLVALSFFLVAFLPNLGEGLPELPQFLVGLTSTSALGVRDEEGCRTGSASDRQCRAIECLSRRDHPCLRPSPRGIHEPTPSREHRRT